MVKTALPLHGGKDSIPGWRTTTPHAYRVAKKIKILKTYIYINRNIWGY